MRALCAIKQAIDEPWLKGVEDLYDSDFLVYFKDALSEGIQGVGVRHEHSIIRFNSERTVDFIGGMPLLSKEWKVVNGVMKVSGYPDNVPGREPRTLARKFEHITVAMISYAPEFLEAIERVDTEVLEEAFSQGIIGKEELERRKAEYQRARESVDWSPEARRERLKGWLALRADNENIPLGTASPQLWMMGHRYVRGPGGERVPVVSPNGGTHGDGGRNHYSTTETSFETDEDSYDDYSTESYSEEEESENDG